MTPSPAAPGLLLSRRPAPRRLLVVVALAVMLIAAAVPAVSADDHVVVEYPYTYDMYASADVSNEYKFGSVQEVNAFNCYLGIGLANVENYPELNYLIYEQNVDYYSRELLDGIPQGVFESTYKRPSDNTDQPITIYVTRYTNKGGQHYKTRIIAYPQNWEVGTATGKYFSQFTIDGISHYLPAGGFSSARGTPIPLDGLTGGVLFSNGDRFYTAPRAAGFVGVVGAKESKAIINIDKQNDFINVNIIRQFDKSYVSIVEIYGNTGSVLSANRGTDNVFMGSYRLSELDNITVYSEGMEEFHHTFRFAAATDPAGFALALSRSSAQIGETLTATLTVQDDAPHYSYLVWSCTPDDYPDMATWSYRILDENGNWYERVANGDEIPISAADALTYQATPAYPGGHHIGVTIYDHHPPCQGLEQRATLAKSFEAVHKPSSSPVRIQVVDERTGALIAGSNIQIIDSQLPPFEGTGINPIIDTTLPHGSEMFYLQRNVYDEPRYRIFADADGYRQVTENQWFSVNPPTPNTVTTVTVQMAAAAAPPEDPNNAYVTFRIRDEDGNPVKEARVTLDRWVRAALGTRPVQFEVPRGATYQYTVEPIDAGLYPATGSVTVGAEDRYEVNVVLLKTPPATPGPGDHPGATPPPGPTPDRRTNEEKGQAVIDMVADNAEGIGALALICLLMGLLKLMVKW